MQLCTHITVASYLTESQQAKELLLLGTSSHPSFRVLPLGGLIDPIMALAGKDGRKTGDNAAGTMVVNA